jgi:hypothetical protein
MGARDIIDGVLDTFAGAVVDRMSLAKASSKGGGTGQLSTSTASNVPDEPHETPSAQLWDPFALLDTLGYRERYSMATYDALQQLAYKVPIFPPIRWIRRKQVLLFSEPAHDENQPGFTIRLRDRDASPSKKQRTKCRDMEEWIQNTGSSQALIKDGFGSFLEKSVDDSLVYDQHAFECVLNGKGEPADFYAVDGASIRLVDQPWERDIAKMDEKIRYVQVHDNSVIAEFTPQQLCFGVRNPRTDLRVNGYGLSELEAGMRIATSLIFGYEYNTKFFSQGTVAKGMLNVPQVPDKRLRIFAQQWHMIVSGISNAWRTPITNFQDAKWIDLQKSNRDMEFAQWIDFLIKIFAALELIDPVEFNMVYGNQGQTGQMFQAGTENRVKHSKDKGLRPILMHIQGVINRYLIWRIDPELMFVFTGLDPKEAKAEVDIQKTQVSYLMTVDEMRKQNDMPKLPDGKGEVILDPNWMQASNMKDQQAQMEAQGGMGGDEDQGGMMGGGGAPGGEQGQPGGQGGGGGEPDEEEGMSDQDWEQMLNQASGKALEPGELRKAHVREVDHGDVVEYDITIGE